MPEITIDLDGENIAAPKIDAKTGAMTIENPDGSVVINFDPPKSKLPESTGFGENLAVTLPADRISEVANTLLQDIQSDVQSRQAWLDTRTQGLSLLGLELEEPRGDIGASTAPLEGMSTVKAPLLLGEVLRAQATARGELLPADGPVKVVNVSTDEGVDVDELAEALEKDLNTYLTRTCTEYYPDTDRMLFYTVFGGSGFKKLFHCPLRKRVVSESVDAADLIVNAGTTDLRNARRITHVVRMRESMVKRMMLVGAYKDVPLGYAFEEPDAAASRKAQIEGVDDRSQQPQDQRRTIYEVCCEWDFGEGPDGMPLPYKITLDKDARLILEIRRNWREGDELYMPRMMYVRYPYVDAMGFYCLGLLHLLGNTSKALTAAWREMLDAGMFACFPGFLYGDSVARQETNEFRIPPGGGMKLQVGNRDIRQVVMPLPYQPPSPVTLQFAQSIMEASRGLAGAAEIQVGEGHQNAPVGTTLAMLEQATKVMSAVHKRLHAAQAEEFRILAELLREDPESLWRSNPRMFTIRDREKFIQALDAVELVPRADPNNPTHTHRLLKAMAVKMLQQQGGPLYDPVAVDSHILRLIGFTDPQELFAKTPPPPMPPNPAVMMAQAKMQDTQVRAQQHAQDVQAKLAETKMKAQQDAADRQAKQQIESEKLGVERQKIGAEMTLEALRGHAEGKQGAVDALQAGSQGAQ